MAINNNGGVHLAWWLMGLSYSSFTWLLCGHQQLPSNVMLSKWAFHTILYDSRVELRHQDGTNMDLNHGIGEEKEADEFARLFSVYMSLYIHGFPVLMCRFVPCLWMHVKERESIHQHQLPWHGGRLIVSVWSGNKPTTSHSQTHSTDTLHVPVRHLPTYTASSMPSISFYNELTEKWYLLQNRDC